MPIVEAAPEILKSSVLVVDDEPALRFPIAEMLRDAGITVLEAASADEALDILSQNAGIGLVFSDVRMPGSMDGLGLAEAIEARGAGIAVLLTSGNVPSQIEPYRHIIPKPYSLSLVTGQILMSLAMSDHGPAH